MFNKIYGDTPGSGSIAVRKQPSAEFQKNFPNRFWAPPHIGLPVGAGLPSLPRVDPVPKNLLFSEDGPDGFVRHFVTDSR